MQAPPPWLMETFGKLPTPLQQRAQELLMKIMKDTFLPAVATVPIAWGLAYVPHFVKMGAILRCQRVSEYNNQLPRTTDPDGFGTAAPLIKRCIACHLNGLESFPAFAVAVLLCKIQRTKPFEVTQLCLRYLLARTMFTVCYIAGSNDAVAGLRTLSWMGSVHSIWRLYAAALTA
eukprot:gb/GFBE01035112.1/.p1 GENE.gb/GFBE01035112.1/~~gb/GFBE01035112.1/.p1  ORF type:complete len:175 (+),score=42.78 gb/GFBE01035112.1/:1-525(+)